MPKTFDEFIIFMISELVSSQSVDSKKRTGQICVSSLEKNIYNGMCMHNGSSPYNPYRNINVYTQSILDTIIIQIRWFITYNLNHSSDSYLENLIPGRKLNVNTVSQRKSRASVIRELSELPTQVTRKGEKIWNLRWKTHKTGSFPTIRIRNTNETNTNSQIFVDNKNGQTKKSPEI